MVRLYGQCVSSAPSPATGEVPGHTNSRKTCSPFEDSKGTSMLKWLYPADPQRHHPHPGRREVNGTEVWLERVGWEHMNPPQSQEGDVSRSCGPHSSQAWSPSHHHPMGVQSPLGRTNQQDSFMMTPEGPRHPSLADGESGPMASL